MLTKTYTVQDPYGLHARPAGLIVKEAQRYTAEVTLTNEKNGKSASAKGLFALMGLEITQGDDITLTANGADEQQALQGVGAVIEERLCKKA
ncbi:MAG: HPr family phosphocarrier protein [Clostridia bacterium]|nr:HPr family phosphocarrier protein [Clostridia bacterium]